MGAGVSSGSGGPAADMYERLVKAVLGRDKDASARAQQTAERLLRVLQAQAQNLKVRNVDVEQWGIVGFWSAICLPVRTSFLGAVGRPRGLFTLIFW